MKYEIDVRDPETGIVKTYSAESAEQLEWRIFLFLEAGREILDYREIIGEGHSESKLSVE